MLSRIFEIVEPGLLLWLVSDSRFQLSRVLHVRRLIAYFEMCLSARRRIGSTVSRFRMLGTFFAGKPPAQFSVYVLVALASLAMGIQSAIVYALGVYGVVTTAISATWTDHNRSGRLAPVASYEEDC